MRRWFLLFAVPSLAALTLLAIVAILSGAARQEPAADLATLSGDRVAAVDDLIASEDPFDRLVAIAVANGLRGAVERASASYCFETPRASVILDPNTDPARIPELLEWLRNFYAAQLEGTNKSMYERTARWYSTAYTPSTGMDGTPITLSWSLVPDGTAIDGGTSSMFASFNAAFGDTIWRTRIRDCFARWAGRTGITYVEEPDDGAQHPDSPGVPGVRGDCRIGARNIDGSSGVLAYNFFPDGGDMVLDTGDATSFANPSFNNRFFRNVVMHEHGHGFGLLHVDPVNQTKLMEAFASTLFNGPQDDDIRGGMKSYGDPKEDNDDSLNAYPLTLVGDSLRDGQLSIDRGGDYDWYLFTANVPNSKVTVTVDPLGSTYQVGPEGGTTVTVSTDSIIDLQFGLYDATGTVQLALANAAGMGATETLTDFTLPSTGNFLIRVWKQSVAGLNLIQRYELHVKLTLPTGVEIAAPGLAAPSRLDLAVAPNPVTDRTRATFRLVPSSPYSLEVFDLSGRLVSRLEGRAPAGGLVEVPWGGRDGRGAILPSGVYMLRATSGALTETARAVVVR